MTFELSHEDIELPQGDAPLVLIAPSTSQDPGCRLVSEGLAALADEPVRVVATTNNHVPPSEIEVPPNARLVDWLSYSQVMPEADLVICHGGHGTVVRALGFGVPVLCCPAAGDMAENAARAAWAGAGLMVPWRLTRSGSLRLAVRRLLSEPRFRARAEEIAVWSQANDGAVIGAGSRSRAMLTDEMPSPDERDPRGLRVKAPGVGFEPTTLRLTAERSSAELPRNGWRAIKLKQSELDRRAILYRQHGVAGFDFRMAVCAEQRTLTNLLAKFRYRLRAPTLCNPKGLLSRIEMVKCKGRKALVVAA